MVIFAYCSGNNVIIFSNAYSRLQTIYLEADGAAVDINPCNGFIAVAVDNYVCIFKPLHEIMKAPKWEFCCKVYHDETRVNSVCWGAYNELVVGSQYLSFWKIKDEFGEYKPVLLWNKKHPKAVYQCRISENSQLIASFGKYDHTVKLWRRTSISGEQDIFSLTLLPHPAPVAAIRWKRLGLVTPEKDFERSQVIYTLCSDRRLRVWSCYEAEAIRIVQQWGSIQLSENQRYCFLIDSGILRKSLKKGEAKNDEIETEPDFVFFGTPDGHFEVYTLTGLSQCPPKPLGSKKLLSKHISYASFVRNPDYLYFAEAQPCGNQSVSVVVHDLRGVIRQSTMSVSHLLDSKVAEIGQLQNKFTGTNKSIQTLIRSSDGEAMLTVSRFSENCVWCPQQTNKASLQLRNVIFTGVPVRLAVVHEKGQLVICFLENSKIQAWECPHNQGDQKKSFMRAEYELSHSPELGDPILMLNTPEPQHSHDRHFVALIYRDGSIRAFKVSMHAIEPVSSENLDISGHDIYRISTIDPVHSHFFSNRPLVSLTTENGITRSYKAIVNADEGQIKWIKDFELNTGMQNIPLIRGSSTNKLCIVDSTGKKMSMWDMKRGVLEYEETFEDTIEDIDWTSTPFGQSIVSVGFKGYALLYTQLRYDYTNNNPSYLPIEKIDITSHTDHNIGDSTWLKDGMFVVASGNQLYVKDKFFDQEDPFTHRSIGSRRILSNDILHLSSVLNGPLPVYHPQFLIQALYANKLRLVKELLLRLFLELRKLNFDSNDTVNLDSNLNTESYKFLISNDRDYPEETFPDPFPEYNTKVSAALTEQLTQVTLPYLTRHQQITLITVIGAIEDITKNESAVDHNGIRFLLGVKLFLSHRNSQRELLMRDVTWALHSDSKELLISIFDSSILSWERAKEFKIAYWSRETDLLRKFEQIAKHEFSKSETRDPSKCAIFYLALKKKQILISLWKMSVGHSEQQKMLKFLNNDFSEARWRSAALKNAFVLLSKHRFMDAACFFLLADSLEDSVNVLYKQVNDMDLAIGVCRVYEGDNGPVLGGLLLKQALPTAIMQNDRWMTSFIYWKLRRQHVAIKALVTAPVDLENNAELVDKESCVNKSFLVEDPALLILYAHLRKRNVKYFMGSLQVENTLEYKSVLRVAEILGRMGCDFLALSMIKNWEFMENDARLEKLKGSAGADFNINSIAYEPTKTELVRPSLFDKFSDSSSGAQDSTINSISQGTTNGKAGKAEKAKNLLDDFMPSSSGPSSGGNLLDEYSPESADPNTASPTRNILEDHPTTSTGKTTPSWETAAHTPTDSLDGTKAKAMTSGGKSAKPALTAPRNLLDDFM